MPQDGDRSQPRRGRRAPTPALDDLDGGAADNLLLAAGRGDQSSYAAFYDQTAPVVFGLLLKGLTEPEKAVRAAERVYLQMWRTAPCFDPTDRSACSQLLITARHELVSQLHEFASEAMPPDPGQRGREPRPPH